MTDNKPNLLYQSLAITPLDGRNYLKIKKLSFYFSEFALNKYRLKVEIEYLKQLSIWKIIRKLNNNEIQLLSKLINNFNIKEFIQIKKIEEKTNHDVKAVEYYLKNKLSKTTLKDIISFVHFGMTSEDTNNLSYGLMLKDFNENILKKELTILINQLKTLAKQWKNVSMLARTHGQPAVSTTIGKEIANYVYRLKKQLNKIDNFKFEGKFNGAVGTNSALKTVIPEKNWLKLTSGFVNFLGLKSNQYTTQILFYDNYLEYFQIVSLVNGILYDLCINIWQYIMLEVFHQKKKNKEVGSSTMPQKINPIYFENAEGNLMLANSMFDFFERKLIHSRLQRDLSDSTIRRNFGESLGYSLIGWKNIKKGIDRLEVNKKYLQKELNNHFEILSEVVQLVLRLKNDDKGYEKIKSLTRGKTMNHKEYIKLLKSLGLDKEKKLNDLTPDKYLGYAVELADKV